MNEIKIFSPATVSNVACGFDILGFYKKSLGDEMIVKKTKKKGLKITKIEGFNLPKDIQKNVAGVSASAMLEKIKPNFGFEIEIFKKIKPGSGIGSSGASSAGSVYAINKLLGNPFNEIELLNFAMKGEYLASNAEHADNIAPAILGGFTLVKNISPLNIISLPYPKDLYCVIIHPQIEIKTSESRKILPKNVSLKNATIQLTNLGGLIHGLHTNNYDIIKSSLKDELIEMHRSKLIPLFDEVKENSMNSGALGCSISGSGPSIFSLCKGKKIAEKIEKSIINIYSSSDIEFSTHVSKINKRGIYTISKS